MYNEKLFKLRVESNLTQQDIANILKLNSNAYAQYEREEVTIPIKHLNTLCNYYKVSIDYIYNLTNNKEYINSRKDIDKIKSGQRLKELRKKENLTQIALAHILNTTQSVLADYERGRYIISTAFLYFICHKYHTSADYLLGKTDEPKHLN